MQQFLLVLLIILSTISVFTQVQFEIRKKIVPLHSSRADVEKIARFVKIFGNFVGYETDNEFIYVYYSKAECVGHGWNVPVDRVLDYRSYPKRDLMFEDVLKANKNLIETVDDTATSYLINQTDGIVYVGQVGEGQKVEYISFNPLPSDSDLRCKGFPEYSLVSDHYAPFDTFTIKNTSNWDVTQIYNTLHRVKENPDLKGYIFIYCKKREKLKCQELKKKVERYVFNSSNLKSNQIVVILGGYRSRIEIETFLIPKDNPPPVARPIFPSEF